MKKRNSGKCVECGQAATELVDVGPDRIALCTRCFPRHGLRYQVENLTAPIAIALQSGEYDQALESLEDVWARYGPLDKTTWTEGLYRSIKMQILGLQGDISGALEESAALELLMDRAIDDKVLDGLLAARILRADDRAEQAAERLDALLAEVEHGEAVDSTLLITAIAERVQVAPLPGPGTESLCLRLLRTVVARLDETGNVDRLVNLPLRNAVEQARRILRGEPGQPEGEK